MTVAHDEINAGDASAPTAGELREAAENLSRFLPEDDDAMCRPMPLGSATGEPCLDPPAPLGEPAEPLANKARGRWAPVLWSGAFLALSLLFIWAPTLGYLKYAPEKFEASWRIILPGEGVKTGINLENVGEAKSSARSVFGSRDFDPRATYREIAASSIVTSAAADEIGAEPHKFAAPKIKAIPQTAILQFTIRRGSPDEAVAHAAAYMEAFDARVEALRRADMSTRQQVSLRNIDTVRDHLDERREAKRALQDSSDLMSPNQFDSLVGTYDAMRDELIHEEATLGELDRKFHALSKSLRVDPASAGDALILKSDRLFQSLAAMYADAETEVVGLSGTFGPNHPTLATARAKRNRLRNSIEARSVQLIGTPPTDMRLLLDLTGSPERSALFGTVMQSYAELEGQRERVARLRASAADIGARVRRLASVAEDLSAAQREQQVAEAIYSTVLADIDLSQTDPFAAYPLYQLLDEPARPTRPVGPHRMAALAGAAGATGFVLLALLAYWLRRRLRK